MTVKMGWDQIDKPREGGDSRFVACADGESVTLRIIDMVPGSFRVHQISTKNDQGEEIFRSIQETPKPDDDYIDQNTNRFPAIDRHAIRCVVYDEDDEPEALKVLVGGVQIFKQLRSLFEKFGDITEFDIVLSREGKARDTTWSVSAAPQSNDIDIEEWVETMEGDDQWNFDNLFPPITPEQQQKIIEEAGIDITYDPVLELLEEMTLEEASKTRLSFGKYGPEKMGGKGKTVGQIWKIDQGWIIWAANNVTSNDQVAAACRFMVDNTDAVEKGSKTTKEITDGASKKGSGKKAKKDKKGKKSKKEEESKALEPDEEEEVEEDDSEDEASRDDWTGKGTPENYLARWFGKGGNEEKTNLAIAILKSEGTTWPPEDEEPEDDPDDEEPEDPDDDTEYVDPDNMDADELRDTIMEVFSDEEEYEEPQNIVSVVKKFGKGKSRLRDLKEKQLRKLLTHLLED